MIYERLNDQGRLASIMDFTPAADWQNQVPRTLVHPGYEKNPDQM